jgi:hypothetical protein
LWVLCSFWAVRHGEATGDLASILSLLAAGDVQSVLGIELGMGLDEDLMDVDISSGLGAAAALAVGSPGASSSSGVRAAAAAGSDSEAIGWCSITSISFGSEDFKLGVPTRTIYARLRFFEEEATPTHGHPTRNRGCQWG